MKNQKLFYWIIFIFAALIIYTGWQYLKNDWEVEILPAFTPTPLINQVKSYPALKDDQGEVTVEATPIQISPGKEILIRLVFDTHSVDLNYEYARISNLTDDKGNSYPALSWDGGNGGHHLTGTLKFPVLPENVKLITLTITEIDNTDRIFKWDL